MLQPLPMYCSRSEARTSEKTMRGEASWPAPERLEDYLGSLLSLLTILQINVKCIRSVSVGIH